MSAPPETAAMLRRELLRGRIGDPDLNLYAIVDGARDARVSALVSACKRGHACLYSGNLPKKLEAAAPWLVAFDEEDAALDELLANGWGESWGIFILSSASLGQLRKHFRKFLQVFLDDGRKLYFRLYDPRVARAYLPTCTRSELDFVFGPVSELLVENADSAELLRFTLDEQDGLARKVVRYADKPVVAAPAPKPAPAPAPAAPPLPADPEALRDALLEKPGDAPLLARVASLAAEQFADASKAAPKLWASIEGLTAVTLAWLDPILAEFPGNTSWKASFAALAPVVQGRSTLTARAHLAASCQAFVDLDELIEQVSELRGQLRVATQEADAAEEARVMAEVQRALEQGRARSAAWPGDDDPKLSAARKGIDRLAARQDGRAPSARVVSSGLTSLMAALDAQRRTDERRATARVAQGLAAALRGTTGQDGLALVAPKPVEAPAAPDAPVPFRSEDALPPRLRRYTMRRRAVPELDLALAPRPEPAPALPAARERLVIREEQMLALADAVRRDVADRLLVHVRRVLPARAAELGEVRTREVVDLGLDRAAALGIQKVPALETLVELMVKIDPEFVELEEYSWAKDLLHNDMLEPNSRPALIRQRLEE